MRSTPLVSSEIGKTLICIDGIVNFDMTGSLYNIYLPEPIEFTSIFGLVSVMDNFFDEIAFPQSYYEDRAFNKKTKVSKKIKKEVQQHMPEDILTTEQGKKATFMVQVQFRQNSTWQGTITWIDEKRTQRFRSTLEMIKLMDNALAEGETESGVASASAWQ